MPPTLVKFKFKGQMYISFNLDIYFIIYNSAEFN